MHRLPIFQFRSWMPHNLNTSIKRMRDHKRNICTLHNFPPILPAWLAQSVATVFAGRLIVSSQASVCSLTSDMVAERLAAAGSRQTTVVRRVQPCSYKARQDAVVAARRSTRSRASVRRCAVRRRTCRAAAGSASLSRSPAPRRTAARTCSLAERSSSREFAPDGSSSPPAPPTRP